MATVFDQFKLILSASQPLAWAIAPALWLSGLIHSSTNAQSTPGILFAAALTLPTCLGEIVTSVRQQLLT